MEHERETLADIGHPRGFPANAIGVAPKRHKATLPAHACVRHFLRLTCSLRRVNLRRDTNTTANARKLGVRKYLVRY
ncbi:unnamed protein product, partial [Iphiclides podalirius]